MNEDLKELNICLDFETIAAKSKESFKQYVKEKARDYSFTILRDKKQTSSKLKNFGYLELETRKYLIDSNFNLAEKG